MFDAYHFKVFDGFSTSFMCHITHIENHLPHPYPIELYNRIFAYWYLFPPCMNFVDCPQTKAMRMTSTFDIVITINRNATQWPERVEKKPPARRVIHTQFIAARVQWKISRIASNCEWCVSVCVCVCCLLGAFINWHGSYQWRNHWDVLNERCGRACARIDCDR